MIPRNVIPQNFLFAERSGAKENLCGTQLRYRQDWSGRNRNWVPDQFSFVHPLSRVHEKKIVRDDVMGAA